MAIIKSANLLLRFTLELCALVAIGYWGFHLDKSAVDRTIIGIGVPLVAAVLWGTFVSPKARVKLPDFGRLLVEFVVFGSAVSALYEAGQLTLAVIFAIFVAVHLPLTFILKQREK
ncbi:MAG: YrdB family protein [Candidatus Promineifilaceae bacterium]